MNLHDHGSFRAENEVNLVGTESLVLEKIYLPDALFVHAT